MGMSHVRDKLYIKLILLSVEVNDCILLFWVVVIVTETGASQASVKETPRSSEFQSKSPARRRLQVRS